MNDQQNFSTPQPAVTSAMTRMSNVFMAPTELYSEIASVPSRATSWLIPFLVLCVLAVGSSYVVYNNPSLRQQIYDMQTKAMKKSVEQGKMTQQQMEQASDQIENSGPVMFVIIGSAIQIFGICMIFFVGALCIWLIAKLGLKSPAGYSKFLEIIGLSEWIAVVGTIVVIILMNLMNYMSATPGGGLLLGDSFDMMNKGHKLLAALNVFTIWQAGVCGIGVAKATGKSMATGLCVSYGVWVFWVLVTTFLF